MQGLEGFAVKSEAKVLKAAGIHKIILKIKSPTPVKILAAVTKHLYKMMLLPNFLALASPNPAFCMDCTPLWRGLSQG